MKLLDGGLESRKPVLCRLDEQQGFLCFFDRALPAIDRGQAGDEIDAGREASLDEVARELAALVKGADGGKRDSGGKRFIGHGISIL